MKFISLFAGIGGFDLGLERAGHECLGQVEIDKKATAVLKKHWEGVPRHADIRTAREWAREKGFTETGVDFVCGGFPCQDVSVAGRREGLKGNRTGLFFDAVEFAKEVKAKFILLENVPGLLTSNEGRDFGVILNSLAEAGYPYLEWRVLDSQFFGIPQRRRRLFIIASSTDRSKNPVFIERQSLPRDNKPSNEAGQNIAEASTKGSKETSESNQEAFGESSFGTFKQGQVSTLKASGGVVGGGLETLTIQPYVKSRKAMNKDDYETWVEKEKWYP